MMSQQPLPNAKAVQVTAQVPSGDSHERLNCRPMSDHDDDHCTSSVTAKTFPETLKEILSDPENQDAIAWLPPMARPFCGPDEGAWFNKSFFKDYTCDKLKVMKCAKRKKSQPVIEFHGRSPLRRDLWTPLFAKDPIPDRKARRPLINISSSSLHLWWSTFVARRHSVCGTSSHASIDSSKPRCGAEVSALTHTSMYPTSFLNPTLNAT
ncbi:hypothetical protein MHU86_18548 [Fragilaria crotonensis]|nr:hypothetical protein MHU86_18548 [Fragilaria crotonensis]